MSITNKRIALNKFGFTGSHKHIGINIWRFCFNAVSTVTGTDQTFFVEFEFLNSWNSINEPVLGYKSRVNITSDDLQYALAGDNPSGVNAGLHGEKIVTPSYVVIRVGKTGSNGAQLCKYLAPSDVIFNPKTLLIKSDSFLFSETGLKGGFEISKAEKSNHPEYLCDDGSVSWNLVYEITKECIQGYNKKHEKWFPSGLKAVFEGNIIYDNEEYNVIPAKSFGYIERYWNKTLPETWMHISSSNLISLINGRLLKDSGFTVQGIFQDRVSFVSTFEQNDISFLADSSQRKYSVIWNCSQTPSTEDSEDDQLHWSVSITSKAWIVDIDLFCKLNDLTSRYIELPEGNRNVLNVLQSGNASGEIKLYKKNKKMLEQIEYARVVSAFCEFGHKEKSISE